MTMNHFLSALLIPAAACGETAQRPVTGAVGRDSAGIRIVSTAADVVPLRVTDHVLLTLGAVDGPAEAVLDRARNPFPLDRDQLVVPDAGSSQVRTYDMAGRLVHSFGREGEGPGEFRNIEWVRPWTGDSLAVWDGRLRRVTFCDPATNGSRMIQLEASADAGATASRPQSRDMDLRQALLRASLRPIAIDIFPDGTLLGRIGEAVVTSDDTTAVRRDTLMYARFDGAGRRIEDLARLPDNELFIWSDGGSAGNGPLPFGRTTAVTILDGSLVVADDEGFRVLWIGTGGGMSMIGRVPYPSTAVSRDVVEAYRAKRLGQWQGTFGGRFADATRRQLDATPFPATSPYHGELIAGADEVWLERYRFPEDDSPPEWVVFNGRGEAVERVRVPAGVRLTAVTRDRLVGVLTDDLDVEHVVVLARAGPRPQH